MPRRRKGFTASQSKLTSHRMRSATLGTHVRGRVKPTSRHMNADAVGFSNSRKKQRAARGIVDTLVPATATRESSSEYARRVNRREFAEDIQRKARIKRVVFIVVAAVVVIALALAVGVVTFFGSLDAKMGLKDSDAKTALVAAKSASPWYALITADLGAATASAEEAGPDVCILARVDEASRAVTLISIPTNLQVMLKDGKVHKLREAAAQGDAAVISAVSAFAGVDIAHYAKIDAKGLVSLVNTLGGIEVDVKQEVDDPAAGDTYIPAGVQTLDGNAALTYLRAKNFKKGLEEQAANQCVFFATLAARMVESGSKLSVATMLDSVGGDFQTDMGGIDAIDLVGALSGIDADSVLHAQVPGYETKHDNVMYYLSPADTWKAMMDLVKAGQPPVSDEKSSVQVDRGGFKVDVRNGAGITKGASQVADLLRGDGFNVTEVGNAESDAFPETLVVYNGEEHKAQAEDVVTALGMGRTIVGGDYYTYTGDVLVIIGKDWKPIV